jgi:hypothetical protein
VRVSRLYQEAVIALEVAGTYMHVRFRDGIDDVKLNADQHIPDPK